LADPRRSLDLILSALAAAVALATGPLAAKAVDSPPVSRAAGPPFDLTAPTPHRLSFTVDTAPARDVLALLGGAPDAPATLRHLKASANATAAIQAEGLSPDDFYGRLVSTIAGTPDPLLSTFIAKIPYFTRVLDAIETDGTPGAVLEGRRIASLLPTGTPLKASFVVVPFLGVSGFAEVSTVRDGDRLVLSADLPRLTGANAPGSRPEAPARRFRRGLALPLRRARAKGSCLARREGRGFRHASGADDRRRSADALPHSR
jgi:hypothetical protein